MADNTTTLFKRRLTGVLLSLVVFAATAFAADPLTFAVMGDTGTGQEPQLKVARQMMKEREKTPYDFVLMLGDNLYPDGDPALLKPRFEEPYRGLLAAGVKFYAVLGNHDVKKGREAQQRYDKFNMGGEPYYSFRKGEGLLDKITGGGLIEFFALDSNRMTPQQVGWLDGKLRASEARWKVVLMHHPLYSSADKHGSSQKLRGLLEPVLVRNKVDAVFAGHDHVYERTKPQQGITYFVSGAGGQLRRGDLNFKSPLLAAGNDEINSFLIVRVTGEQMRVEAIGSDGRRLDSVSLTKAKN